MGIRENTLRELAAANTLGRLQVVGEAGGFTVVVPLGDARPTLETARGDRRLFVNLNTAARYLSQMGITSFDVDVSKFRAVRLRPARPDRAEALRGTRSRPNQAALL